jgi:hypothetical protein
VITSSNTPKRIGWLLVQLYKAGFFDAEQLCVMGSLVGRFLAMVKGILCSLEGKPESKTGQSEMEKCFSNAKFTAWLAAYGYVKDWRVGKGTGRQTKFRCIVNLTSNYGLPNNTAQGGIERVLHGALEHPDEQKGKAALATYIVTYEICFSHMAKQVKK